MSPVSISGYFPVREGEREITIGHERTAGALKKPPCISTRRDSDFSKFIVADEQWKFQFVVDAGDEFSDGPRVVAPGRIARVVVVDPAESKIFPVHTRGKVGGRSRRRERDGGSQQGARTGTGSGC